MNEAIKIKTESIEYKNTILLIFTLDDGMGLTYGFSAHKGMSGTVIHTKNEAIKSAKETIDQHRYTNFIKGDK